MSSHVPWQVLQYWRDIATGSQKQAFQAELEDLSAFLEGRLTSASTDKVRGQVASRVVKEVKSPERSGGSSGRGGGSHRGGGSGGRGRGTGGQPGGHSPSPAPAPNVTVPTSSEAATANFEEVALHTQSIERVVQVLTGQLTKLTNPTINHILLLVSAVPAEVAGPQDWAASDVRTICASLLREHDDHATILSDQSFQTLVSVHYTHQTPPNPPHSSPQ